MTIDERERLNSIRRSLDEIYSTCDELASCWEGDAADALVRALRERCLETEDALSSASRFLAELEASDIN